MRAARAGLVAAVFLLLPPFAAAACGVVGAEENTGGEPTVTVFAASSLTDAFQELGAVFEARNPGAEVRFNFGGSSTLLAQIRQGAPADVFASADRAKMGVAVDEGFVAAEPEIFARNRLVVMVPLSNPAGIESYRNLSRPGVRFVLAQDGVPVAEYAEKSLRRASARYGGGFSEKVLSNIVSREGDVRAAVNRVSLGDADATLAYRSDVTPDIRGRVEIIEVSEELNVVAAYPVATLDGAEHPELAREWVDLVLSGKGQRVMRKWGFEPAG